jgi:chromate transport protein ChrA
MKILKIVGSIFTGLNFGLISPFAPIYLLVLSVLYQDSEWFSANRLAVCALVTAVIATVLTYVYAHNKKREHESLSVCGMSLAISFIVGAIIIMILLFIYAAGEEYRLG